MKKSSKVNKQRQADQIKFWDARGLKRQGVRDSASGLQPRLDETGGTLILSPYVQRELAAFHELAKREWLQCEADTAEFQITAEKLRQRIMRLKTKQQNASGAQVIRYKGEEMLSSWIVQGRRGREFKELEHLEEEYHEMIQKISEIENTVRLYTLRVEENTVGRISIYLQGCAEANPSAQLPPVSSIIVRSDAESAYMSRHKRELLPESKADRQNEGESDYA